MCVCSWQAAETAAAGGDPFAGEGLAMAEAFPPDLNVTDPLWPTLQAGDKISVSCVYNSLSRTIPTASAWSSDLGLPPPPPSPPNAPSLPLPELSELCMVSLFYKGPGLAFGRRAITAVPASAQQCDPLSADELSNMASAPQVLGIG